MARRQARRLTGLTTGAIALVGAMLAPAGTASAAAAPAGAYADAYGVSVDAVALTAIPANIPPDTIVAGASQTCPPQAAKPAQTDLLSTTALSPVVPQVATITSIAGASCGLPSAVASAQTAGVQALAVPGPASLVTADVIRAQANSDCKTAPNGKGSLFVNLTVAGSPVPPDVPPNTVIDVLPAGVLIARVIVNEQHPAASGRGIVVNGLHIIGASAALRGDIIISHAASGVVCPDGSGSNPGTLPKPDISFAKTATPSTAHGGDTVTYTAKVTNNSADACDVLRLVDHISPVFGFVSTAGPFGTTADTSYKRSDGGVDAVLRPTSLTLAAHATATQTFVIKLKDDIAPGTYYNNLEIFCNANGDFVSGPLAPVTVPPAQDKKATPIVVPPHRKQLPPTGSSPLIALAAMTVVGAGLGLRRRTMARRA